jgi:hypothetical protein
MLESPVSKWVNGGGWGWGKGGQRGRRRGRKRERGQDGIMRKREKKENSENTKGK